MSSWLLSSLCALLMLLPGVAWCAYPKLEHGILPHQRPHREPLRGAHADPASARRADLATARLKDAHSKGEPPAGGPERGGRTALRLTHPPSVQARAPSRRQGALAVLGGSRAGDLRGAAVISGSSVRYRR